MSNSEAKPVSLMVFFRKQLFSLTILSIGRKLLRRRGTFEGKADKARASVFDINDDSDDGNGDTLSKYKFDASEARPDLESPPDCATVIQFFSSSPLEVARKPPTSLSSLPSSSSPTSSSSSSSLSKQNCLF
jgi:hypothetical protein